MILGIEIALIVIGIYGLIKGRLPITRNRVVEGTPARLLALLGFVPLPLGILIVVLILGVKSAMGAPIDEKEAGTVGVIVEIAVVLGTLILFYALGFLLATDTSRRPARREDERRRRARDDEDDEPEDRPRRRRRDADLDHDQGDEHIQPEDRPRRRQRDDEDDEGHIKSKD